jgi:acyl-coenzyme A thioesterase PaaI-like protein
MWAAERAMKWLGLGLDSVGPGRAEMSMTVEPHQVSAHGICHQDGAVVAVMRANSRETGGAHFEEE